MVQIVPREAWTSAKRVTGSKLKPGPITVHWAGGGREIYMDALDPVDAFAERLRVERAAHMDPNGRLKERDIAYNYMIDWDGRIWEARGIQTRSGANGPGNNADSVAVQFAVGKKNPPAPQVMVDSLRRLGRHLVDIGVSEPYIRGHRDIRRTECPGDSIYARATGSLTMHNQVLDLVQPKFLYSKRARKPFWTVWSNGRVEPHNGASEVKDLEALGVTPDEPITGAVTLNSKWILLTSANDGGTFQVEILR